MSSATAIHGGLAAALAALERNGCNPRPSGDGYRARCPNKAGHKNEDRNPSLSVSGAPNGTALFHCHAGTCSFDAILNSLEPDDLERAAILGRRPKTAQIAGSQKGVVSKWIYRDEQGCPLFLVERINKKNGGKAFPQSRPDGHGGWLRGISGVRKVPYRLPELIAAIDCGETIYIAEGEKCCDALVAHGLAATCNSEGQGKWRQEHTKALAGAKAVRVLADNDQVGRDHAQRVAAACRAAGVRDIRVVEFPGLMKRNGSEGGDVADWLEDRQDRPKQERRDELLAFIESAPPWSAGAPLEFVVEGEQIALADQALDVLAAYSDAGVYVRARQLVRVVRDRPRGRGIERPAGAPIIEALSLDALRDSLARALPWVRLRAAGGRVEILPPEWLVRNLLSRAGWPFPVLEGVIETPSMRPDGTILDSQGFDEATGLLYVPRESFPAIPDAPSAAEAHEAVKSLLDPIRDFPFRDASDRSAAVAAMLSLVARRAVEGPVPLFAIRAPAPGTGKSLLADVIALIGTGRHAARMGFESDDGETRKRILAIAMEGTPVVLLDNLEGRLGSKSLAAALTAETWKDRLLGVSATVEAPLRAVWLATGNNLGFRGDLGRRVVVVDMDARAENPEDRPASDFRYPDLLGHVAGSRPRLVAAALTLLRAYHLAGRPAHPQSRKGSFEGWDALVRGACVWAALGDPDGGKDRVRREDDVDVAGIREALAALQNAFPDSAFTVAEAARKADTDAGFRDALLELPSVRDKVTSRGLSYALRAINGRPVGGRMLIGAGFHRDGKVRWRVNSTSGAC